jgi:hypothetical protein
MRSSLNTGSVLKKAPEKPVKPGFSTMTGKPFQKLKFWNSLSFYILYNKIAGLVNFFPEGFLYRSPDKAAFPFPAYRALPDPFQKKGFYPGKVLSAQVFFDKGPPS